jgi:hypothetical protein
MKFKDFIQNEEQSGTDRGLMGYGKSSSVRKPSDGQPFAQYLSSVAGQEPRGNTGTNTQAPMFMKKKMKKKMQKT